MRFGGMTGTLGLLVFLGVSFLPPASVNCRPVDVPTPAATKIKRLLPIVFIPGKAGNQIDAKVDRSGLPDKGLLPDCQRKVNRYRMWLDVWKLFRRELIHLLRIL